MMFCVPRNGFFLLFGSLLAPSATEGTPCGDGSTIVKDVAIVGGGLAGLFAASVLDKKDKSYVVIEAQDFLGGRIHSTESTEFNFAGTTSPVTLERGANFMYGVGDKYAINPIYGLFKKHNVTFFEYSYDNQDVFQEDGRRYPTGLLRQKRRAIKQAVRKCLDKEGEKWFDEYRKDGVTTTKDKSAKQLLKKCSGYSDPSGCDIFDRNALLRKAMRFVYAGGQENLSKLKDIGKASYPEDSEEEFDARDFFQKDQHGGTTRMITEFVAEHLNSPDGLIHMSSEVTSIDTHSQPSKALLTATRKHAASMCEQRYEADFVIVTMPQNVIEKGPTTFNPPLNISEHPIKQNIAEKVWFQWDYPWWDESKLWIVVANNHKDGRGLLWLNYNHPDLLPGSNLLMTFVDEHQLDAMGGSINTSMLEAGLENIKDYYPSDRSESTSWTTDPCSLGGWEVWQLGKTAEEFDEAIEPEGVRHLAGAAHCRNFYGFTWGAIFSGIFSAEWVSGRLDNLPLNAAKPAFNPCFDNDGIRRKEWKAFYRPYDWFPVPQNTN